MVPFQRWMAHTSLSALCNLSRVGSESFTSPLEKILERKEGFLTLDIQTTAGIWALQVITLYHVCY